MSSLRYHVFKKSNVCCKCGLEGKYFIKERDSNVKRYHFNLYAIDSDGNEVLMTKDHIIPKSKGGSDNLNNLQTMCTNCNFKKADSVE